MLPPPLAPPLPSRPAWRPRRRIPWLVLLGFALILLAIVGAIAWVGAFSPYGFVRFSVLRADRTVTISRPGDYLIFEEGAGATDPDLPPPLAITVVDERGHSVPVEPLIAPGSTAAPFAYHVPPNEGRAIARFTAPRRGLYLLQVQRLDRDSIIAANYGSDLPSTLAVGRELGMAWLRAPWGLLLFAGVPLAGGVAVLMMARRRGRGERAAKPLGSPAESFR